MITHYFVTLSYMSPTIEPLQHQIIVTLKFDGLNHNGFYSLRVTRNPKRQIQRVSNQSTPPLCLYGTVSGSQGPRLRASHSLPPPWCSERWRASHRVPSHWLSFLNLLRLNDLGFGRRGLRRRVHSGRRLGIRRGRLLRGGCGL